MITRLLLWRIVSPALVVAVLLGFGAASSPSAEASVSRYVRVSSNDIDIGNGYTLSFAAYLTIGEKTGSLSFYIEKAGVDGGAYESATESFTVPAEAFDISASLGHAAFDSGSAMGKHGRVDVALKFRSALSVTDQPCYHYRSQGGLLQGQLRFDPGLAGLKPVTRGGIIGYVSYTRSSSGCPSQSYCYNEVYLSGSEMQGDISLYFSIYRYGGSAYTGLSYSDPDKPGDPAQISHALSATVPKGALKVSGVRSASVNLASAAPGLTGTAQYKNDGPASSSTEGCQSTAYTVGHFSASTITGHFALGGTKAFHGSAAESLSLYRYRKVAGGVGAPSGPPPPPPGFPPGSDDPQP